MNERIQELLIEAHRQTKGGIYTGHISDWTEKFAQLIVRDISQLIENQDIDPAFKHRMSWAVKDRYGVEE